MSDDASVGFNEHGDFDVTIQDMNYEEEGEHCDRFSI